MLAKRTCKSRGPASLPKAIVQCVGEWTTTA